MDWLSWPGVATAWRALSFLALGWLAVFFGRTLLPGQVPLIEQIARVSNPEPSAKMKRYTRRLTALWSAYFVITALFALFVIRSSSFSAGPWVGLGSVAFFVGEHWLRRRLFPHEIFPGLAQQVRDTWTVWHPRKRIQD